MVNEVREVQDLGVIIQVESCRETGIFEGKLEAEEHSDIYSSFPSHPHSQTADLHLTRPNSTSLPLKFPKCPRPGWSSEQPGIVEGVLPMAGG